MRTLLLATLTASLALSAHAADPRADPTPQQQEAQRQAYLSQKLAIGRLQQAAQNDEDKAQLRADILILQDQIASLQAQLAVAQKKPDPKK